MNMKTIHKYRPGTFDSRIITYEKVHHITEKQIASLLGAANLQAGDRVLDGCAGYGSVTKWLLEGTEKKVSDACEFFVFDDSSVQIERAEENLKGHANIKFSVGDITAMSYPDSFFDTVIIKMGLHENPKSVQQEIVKEIFRVVKPGGKFIIWELYLNHATQPIFQAFMHKKNELAGFDALAKNRYFPREDEIRECVVAAGFDQYVEHAIFNPVLSTKVRREEMISRELKESGKSEPDEALFTLGDARVGQLNEFFRNNLTEEQKALIKFEDNGDDIKLYNIDKAIVSAIKPLK